MKGKDLNFSIQKPKIEFVNKPKISEEINKLDRYSANTKKGRQVRY